MPSWGIEELPDSRVAQERAARIMNWRLPRA
jgi:hypothetical protein